MSITAECEEVGCGTAHNFNFLHVSHDYTDDMRLDNTLVLRVYSATRNDSCAYCRS